jgi:hypothetical protein
MDKQPTSSNGNDRKRSSRSEAEHVQAEKPQENFVEKPGRSERIRIIIVTCIILSCILGIGAVIAASKYQRYNYVTLQQSAVAFRLANLLAVDDSGKRIAVFVFSPKDSSLQLMVSSDSGQHFIPRGDKLRPGNDDIELLLSSGIASSVSHLSFGSDKETMIFRFDTALYVLPGNTDSFIAYPFIVSDNYEADSAFFARDFDYYTDPATDSIYVFGTANPGHGSYFGIIRLKEPGSVAIYKVSDAELRFKNFTRIRERNFATASSAAGAYSQNYQTTSGGTHFLFPDLYLSYPVIYPVAVLNERLLSKREVKNEYLQVQDAPVIQPDSSRASNPQNSVSRRVKKNRVRPPEKSPEIKNEENNDNNNPEQVKQQDFKQMKK